MFLLSLITGLLAVPQLQPIQPERQLAPIATATQLIVSTNPVLLGQQVTLTAFVQPSSASGTVTFYAGVAVLGSAPLVSGQAQWPTALLPAGANRLTARFNATSSLASSVSAPVALAVGVAPGTGFPGGVAYPIGLTPSSILIADFNNDGIQDLATADTGDGTVSILLGNGDGSFSTMPDVPAGVNPVSVAVADFNGDGIADLAVVNSGSSSVTILLGFGDGTFQALPDIGVGSNPASAAVADFNGDGIADIAVADASDDTVILLTGNGDGTFLAGRPISIGVGATQIVAADFNKDGNADLAIAGSSPDGVALLIGRGDGTFTVRFPLSAGASPSSLAAADFNGDGILDLVVGDFGNFQTLSGGGLLFLAGKGDGSFAAPLSADAGPNVLAVAVGDLDGDGKSDLAVITSDGLSTYQGNGDGTFQAAQPYEAGQSAAALAVGSFDGLGLTELAVVNQTENAVDVLTGSPGNCSYSVTPGTLLYDGSAVASSLALTASATGCAWAVSADPWILPQMNSGLGSNEIALQVTTNSTGYDRTGSILIADQTVTITQKSTAQQFTDVPVTGYNFDAVNLLKNKGITAGCGPSTFCPDQQITRAQMAVFMVRGVYGGDNFTYSPTPYFTDVPPSAFGFRWIQKMFELGITSGCGNSLYCPNSVVTRAQMAVFIIRARFGATAAFSSPAQPYFTDVPSGAFGFAWIQRMRLDGITSGCNTTLYCPGSSVTRGDMAIFIMRGLFNALYPPGNPALESISPQTLVRGQAPVTFTFTGVNTNFVSGQTTVSTVPHVTVANVLVSSPTTLTVQMSADSLTPVQPVGVVAITGAEQDVLPNGLDIQ